MTTNLALDECLIREAQKLGKHKTKKAAVIEALKEYIQRRNQVRILELFGKITWNDKYDYKKGRQR